jgi:hypothetical protein
MDPENELSFPASILNDQRVAFLNKKEPMQLYHAYKLPDWIPIENLPIEKLVKNHHIGVMSILRQKLEKWQSIFRLSSNVWFHICNNPYAIPVLDKIFETGGWESIKSDPIFKYYQLSLKNMIYWNHLSKLPEALHLLKKHPAKINWRNFCRHQSDISFYEKYFDKIEWKELSANEFAIPFLEKNIPNISWSHLTMNPNAELLLEKRPEKYFWMDIVSYNTSKTQPAIAPATRESLEIDGENVDWNKIAENPAIFQYDYDYIRTQMYPFKEEMMAKMFHPDNYHKFASWGFDEFSD